jgi:hypothetical protein
MAFSCIRPSQFLQAHKTTEANEKSMKSMAHRVEALAELLCTPVLEDDVKEKSRRKVLEE